MNILHITHPWGGGITSYIEDLQQSLTAGINYVMTCSEGDVWVVDPQGAKRSYFIGKKLKLTTDADLPYAGILGQILDDFAIDIVQINSHVGHCFDIFRVPAHKGIPLILIVHDFFYICPTFHLVDTKGQYCHICNYSVEDGNCLKNHEYLYSDLSAVELYQLRKTFKTVLPLLDALVFPSRSSYELFKGFYQLPAAKCHVIPHGTGLVRQPQPMSFDRDAGRLRVGILGSMLKHKGKAVLEQVMSQLQDAPVVFFHFGDGELVGPRLVKFGRYDRSRIAVELQSANIDVVLILSTWPETFSYTLTESIVAGIPPIVSDLGALADRVRDDQLGWVVNPADVGAICHLLEQLVTDNRAIDTYRANIAVLPIRTLADMAADYQHLYGMVQDNAPYREPYVYQAFADINRLPPVRSIKQISLLLMRLKDVFYRGQRKIRRLLTKKEY